MHLPPACRDTVKHRSFSSISRLNFRSESVLYSHLTTNAISAGVRLKIVFIFLVFVLSVIASAQGSKNKFEFGVVFSPELSYRFLSNSEKTSSSNHLVKTRNNSEIPAFAYSAGLLVSKWYGQRQYFESGILFSDNGYAMKDLDIINASYQTIGKANLRIRYKWLGIPLRYVFHPVRESNFIMGIGAAYQFLLEHKTITKLMYSDGREEIRNANGKAGNQLMLLLSGGYTHRINESWRLSAEMQYRQGLNNVHSDSPLGTYLWNLGLNAGLYYSLGK